MVSIRSAHGHVSLLVGACFLVLGFSGLIAASRWIPSDVREDLTSIATRYLASRNRLVTASADADELLSMSMTPEFRQALEADVRELKMRASRLSYGDAETFVELLSATKDGDETVLELREHTILGGQYELTRRIHFLEGPDGGWRIAADTVPGNGVLPITVVHSQIP